MQVVVAEPSCCHKKEEGAGAAGQLAVPKALLLEQEVRMATRHASTAC